MFDEMYFLFDLEKSVANSLNDANNTRSASDYAQSVDYRYNKDNPDKPDKYVITTGNLKDNYIKSEVNSAYLATKKNPYLKLLEDFDGTKTSKSLTLRSTDFAYLRDIGVYPINRLIILRRFPEGATVPVDLTEFAVEPISTIVGWVKNDSEFLSFNFGETWQTQGSDSMLHLLLNDMISNEFGIKPTAIMPTPGWGVGFVFGVLHNMGLTDFTKKNIPMGNPNVLKESITRPHNDFGLQSDVTLSLETVYEQKYIGGIDLTVGVMDILYNCLTMGSSDVQYIGKPGTKIIELLKAANNKGTDTDAWVKLITTVVSSFVGALKQTLSNTIAAISPKTKEQEDKEKKEAEEKNKGKSSSELAADKSKADLNNQKGALDKLVGDLLQSVLASTVAKYKWPLRGSIAMFTGEAATPWHVTIGNPYSPFLSMNNVYVSNVSVSATGEMMYNDIPKYLNIKVTMKQGRNMGKNEIYSMLGIKYQREYKKLNQ